MMNQLIYKKTYPREEPEEMTPELEAKLAEITQKQLDREAITRLLDTVEILAMPQRLEDASKFVSAAINASEINEMDIEIRRRNFSIYVELSFDAGYIMEGLSKVFAMTDEFGFHTGTKGRDISISMEYYTHAVHQNGKRITPRDG